MRKVYYIRHGLSVHNEMGRFSGRLDSPLSDEGRVGVKEAANSIKNLSIDTIVSSPMSRAKESAEIIAEVIEYPPNQIIFNELFEERDFGILENTPYHPLKAHDEVEGIETVDELIKRAEKAYKWLENLNTKHETILIVSHGSFGRAFRYVITKDSEFHKSPKFYNSEVIRLI